MKFDLSSFVIGSVWPIFTAGIIYLIANHHRHKCKVDGCNCSTNSVYRLLHLHNIRRTVAGLMVYAIYKFNVCKKGHVSVTMKTGMFSSPQILHKPVGESDWTSKFINDLCFRAGIRNPAEDYRVFQLTSENPIPRVTVLNQDKGPHGYGFRSQN